MSHLSGYDSEAVGFDSVPPVKKASAAICTQTSEFSESGAASQTNMSKAVGCTASAEDFQSPALEYQAGLNEFLRKVVPGVLEQLAQNDQETPYSSDSEDGEVSRAVQLHELKVGGNIGCGDHQSSVLAVAWSNTNSVAVSVGSEQHEDWCQGPGLIQIFNFKPRGDRSQPLDVVERECVTVLRYHPTVAGLLAYGTASGELAVRQGSSETLNHSGGSARVSCLRWVDASLANVYLTMLVRSRGQRRCAADQVLFSSSSDGAINVWRVNAGQRTFENMVRYELEMGRKPRPDITSFDVPRTHPLRASGDKMAEVFVVGTKSGEVYLCEVKEQLDAAVDPVSSKLEGHNTCVLDVAFSQQKPGVFVSLSTDSEVRVHRVGQPSPLRIFCLEVDVSCMSWLGSSPCFILGLAESGKEALRVYNASTGKLVPVEGFLGSGCVTCVDVYQSGSYRIVAGDAGNTVRVWELPTLRDKSIWDYDM